MTRGYLWLMAGSAVGLQLYWLARWPRQELAPATPALRGAMVFLAALAIFAQHFPVAITRSRKLDVAVAPYFAALLLFSAPAAVLMDMLAGLRSHPGGERLEPQLPASLGVHADPARVTQVVYNLISNAQKYAPTGPITVRAYPMQSRTDGPLDLVRVEVEDTGPGIPAEEQPHVWQRFYRGRAVSELSRVPGTGIGPTMYVTSGALGVEHLSAVQLAHIEYTVQAGGQGTVTTVTMTVVVPDDAFASQFPTRSRVSTGPMATGTIYAATRGYSGAPMSMRFQLNVS